MAMEEERFVAQEPESESDDTASSGDVALEPTEPASQEGSTEAKSSLFIAGIGASAGGLTAIQHFFDQMQTDARISHLPRLLQMHTSMPVTEVSETVQMVADHVYVIPPNRYLSAVDTHLRVSAGEGGERPRSPIDHFFRTLADMHGEHAIGMILSGTGSDGALGIKRIKESGGLTIVQDPLEAEYDASHQRNARASAPTRGPPAPGSGGRWPAAA
jgi:two-component system CheB/CheR fusion protein